MSSNAITWLSIYISTYLPTYLSAYLPTYLSFYLSIFLHVSQDETNDMTQIDCQGTLGAWSRMLGKGNGKMMERRITV